MSNNFKEIDVTIRVARRKKKGSEFNSEPNGPLAQRRGNATLHHNLGQSSRLKEKTTAWFKRRGAFRALTASLAAPKTLVEGNAADLAVFGLLPLEPASPRPALRDVQHGPQRQPAYLEADLLHLL